MILLKRLLLFLIVFLFSISCCVAKTPTKPTNGLTKYTYIDPKFSPEETAYIVEALQEWDCSTKHLVRFVSVSNEKNANLLIQATDGNNPLIKEADKRINVEKKLIEDDPNRNNDIHYSAVGLHIGYTNPAVIFIVEDRMDGPYEVRGIILHEIGHDLGLDHIRDTNSVMYINRSLGSAHITILDLQAFCAIHSCYDVKPEPCFRD